MDWAQRWAVLTAAGVRVLQIINFYISMLADRDEALVKSGALPKRSHFFNSFFYTKVSEKGYNFANVRRWTRKVR